MSEPAALRFGAFELDGRRRTCRGGDLVKLAPQPFKVLELLVRRAGEVVTRNEIRDHVWHGDTFVDFEQGLNFCIRQIREALGDTADAPRFIETLPAPRLPVPDAGEAAEARQPAARDAADRAAVPHAAARCRHRVLAFSLPDALTHRWADWNRWSCDPAWRPHVSRATGGSAGRSARKRTWTSSSTGTLLRAGDEVRVMQPAHRRL